MAEKIFVKHTQYVPRERFASLGLKNRYCFDDVTFDGVHKLIEYTVSDSGFYFWKDLIGVVEQLREKVALLEERDRLKDATIEKLKKGFELKEATIEELELRLEYVEAITRKDGESLLDKFKQRTPFSCWPHCILTNLRIF